jgi:hypothetical protein
VFLLPRAVAKRDRFKIPVTEKDLPAEIYFVSSAGALKS